MGPAQLGRGGGGGESHVLSLTHSQAVMADNNNNGPLLLEKVKLEERLGRQMPHVWLDLSLLCFGRHVSYMTNAGIKTW
jgi:hypothetical protein